MTIGTSKPSLIFTEILNSVSNLVHLLLTLDVLWLIKVLVVFEEDLF
jgi:hypothetical protein